MKITKTPDDKDKLHKFTQKGFPCIFLKLFLKLLHVIFIWSFVGMYLTTILPDSFTLDMGLHARQPNCIAVQTSLHSHAVWSAPL